MKKNYLLFIVLLSLSLTAIKAQVFQPIVPEDWPKLSGLWIFDNSGDLTKATVGVDLELVGSHQAVSGYNENDGATRIPTGSYYKATNTIGANGGGSKTNEYSLLFDFKVPQLGEYYSFLQVEDATYADGDLWVNTSNHIGLMHGNLGYSSYAIPNANEWHRFVMTADLGNEIRLYIDGKLIHVSYAIPDLDDRFALESIIEFFADNNGEDGEFDVSTIAFFDKILSLEEIQGLSGVVPEEPKVMEPVNPEDWSDLVGYWTFDDQNDLTKAEVGTDLELVGSQQAVAGPEDANGAVQIGEGSYYKCSHDIGANGGGSYTNQYTLMVDFKVPSIGQYYAILQTNTGNSNDGDIFINDDGHIGLNGTPGYSSYVVPENEWHRLVLTANLGNSFDYYIDGELIHTGNPPDVDGRFSMENIFLLFADNDGEDNAIDIASVALFKKSLNALEIKSLSNGEAPPNGPVATPINPDDWGTHLTGYWNFDDMNDLTHAEIGNNLSLEGSQEAVFGSVPDDIAVRIGKGSGYKCTTNILANGGGSKTNEFTLVVDFKVPQTGIYHTIYQANPANSDDAEIFVKSSDQIGITGTPGYSYFRVDANVWYRLVLTVDLGTSFDYYIDGHLIHKGNPPAIDSRFSLGDDFLLFKDNDGEDNPIDVALVAMFDKPLSPEEIGQLGGYGNVVPEPQVDYMNPYLQTVTESSIYVSWHSDDETSTIVQYGADETLGSSATGNFQLIGNKNRWHTVQLTGLQSNSKYFYRCISGEDTSSVSSFKTKKTIGTANAHLRFGIFGDSRTNPFKVTQVAEAMANQFEKDYGDNWEDEVDFVLNVGDIVENGNNINQYKNEFFLPYSNLTNKLPFYVSIGNHEGESTYYYEYVKYESLTGDPYSDPNNQYNEKFYTFRYLNCQFIAINSNNPYKVVEQTNWVRNVLNDCEGDPGIDFVFVFNHHPGRTEVWPAGNTAYMQNTIIPLLQEYTKPAMLIYGHSHDYEHGAVSLNIDNPDYKGDMHIMLEGGAGAPLDRWGMYSNQEDYPEIFMSLDHYGYVIIDVDVDDKSFAGRRFSLGHEDKSLANVLVDSWYSKVNQSIPDKPVANAPEIVDNDVILQGSVFAGVDSLFSSQIELTTTPGDFSSPVVDTQRDIVNIYGDTGAPDYTPIDKNEGVDITRLTVSKDILTSNTCGWRIRYRDHNLKWSGWSDEEVFNLSTGIDVKHENDLNFTIAPNPVRGEARFVFDVKEEGKVMLKVYDQVGHEVAIIADVNLQPGNYSYTWIPGNVAPGLYICKLIIGQDVITKKLIYTK